MEKEIPAAVREKDQRKRREVPKKKQTDIRAMLGVTAQVSSSKKQQNGVEVIEIDYLILVKIFLKRVLVSPNLSFGINKKN